MKQVVKYICEVCGKENESPDLTEKCEKFCFEAKEERERAKAEKEFWESQGHDVWYEYNGMRHAEKVDPERFGPHDYGDDHDHTYDCRCGCKCWMGSNRSGGPVNPFGACPNNPKEETGKEGAE